MVTAGHETELGCVGDRRKCMGIDDVTARVRLGRGAGGLKESKKEF